MCVAPLAKNLCPTFLARFTTLPKCFKDAPEVARQVRPTRGAERASSVERGGAHEEEAGEQKPQLGSCGSVSLASHGTLIQDLANKYPRCSKTIHLR